MSAREMFEEVGYFYNKTSNRISIFETWYDFGELKNQEILRFEKCNKGWVFNPKKEITLNFKDEIDIKLFNAINKQVEELG